MYLNLLCTVMHNLQPCRFCDQDRAAHARSYKHVGTLLSCDSRLLLLHTGSILGPGWFSVAVPCPANSTASAGRGGCCIPPSHLPPHPGPSPPSSCLVWGCSGSHFKRHPLSELLLGP